MWGYEAARRAGFSNLNIDLMSALPGQSLESWMDTLKKTAELKPEHISAYSLIIEEGTPFYERYGTQDDASDGRHEWRNGRENGLTVEWKPLPSEEEDRLMYERTGEFLAEEATHVMRSPIMRCRGLPAVIICPTGTGRTMRGLVWERHL